MPLPAMRLAKTRGATRRRELSLEAAKAAAYKGNHYGQKVIYIMQGLKSSCI